MSTTTLESVEVGDTHVTTVTHTDADGSQRIATATHPVLTLAIQRSTHSPGIVWPRHHVRRVTHSPLITAKRIGDALLCVLGFLSLVGMGWMTICYLTGHSFFGVMP